MLCQSAVHCKLLILKTKFQCYISIYPLGCISPNIRKIQFVQVPFKQIPLNKWDKTGSRRKWGICTYSSTHCSGSIEGQSCMSILEAELFGNFLCNPFREPLRLGGYAACYSDFRATSGSKKIKPDIAQNVISKWYSMNFWLKIGEVLFSIVFIFCLVIYIR